jgi:pimeloyl-ACP methyl ester carboxylesterase
MPRPTVLLLHGALGAADQVTPLGPHLESKFNVLTLDLPGHGNAPLDGPFTTEHFAAAVTQWLDGDQRGPVDCFGYSMGGYVALEVARRRPELVRAIATLGTKFAWTPEVARRELKFLDPSLIRAKVPYFADVLEQRHTALGWEALLRQTGQMMTALGDVPLLTIETLGHIPQRVRILVGDRDGTVTVEESLSASRALPAGELEVLPRTAHPFEKVSLPRLAQALQDFFLETP